MSRLSYFFSIAASLSYFMAVEAASSAASVSPSEIRALSREIEIHQQTVQSVKLDQELLDERLRALESQLGQIQKELTQISKAITKGEFGKSSEAANTTQLFATWNQWRQQTDQNISHLQKSIAALAKAMQSSNETPVSATPSKVTPPSETYVVQSGDTLEKIAKKHQTTVSILMELNSLKSSKIWKGQKLKLPTSS